MTRKKMWAHILVDNIIHAIAIELAWGRYEGADAIRSMAGKFILNDEAEQKIAEEVKQIRKYM